MTLTCQKTFFFFFLNYDWAPLMTTFFPILFFCLHIYFAATLTYLWAPTSSLSPCFTFSLRFLTSILPFSYIHTYCILPLFLSQTTCIPTVLLYEDPDISSWIWRQSWEFTSASSSCISPSSPFSPCVLYNERGRQMMYTSLCVCVWGGPVWEVYGGFFNVRV